MTRQRLEETVAHLCQKIGSRPSGTKAELKAAQYLESVFKEIGYETAIEPFDNPAQLSDTSAIIVEEQGYALPSVPAQFSACGTVKGLLIYLGTSQHPLHADADIAGRIGLLVPMGPHDETRSLLLSLEQHALAGLIVVSPYMDTWLTKITRYPEVKRMPIVNVAYRVGCKLKRCEGKLIWLSVSGEKDNGFAQSQNVVARLPGSGDNILVVSAHYDTAPFIEGALDNAGGVAMLVELARRLTGKTFPSTIYFVASGSEEYGRTDGVGAGAQAFYQKRTHLLEKCIAHIEIDNVGNLLGNLILHIGGNKPFKDIAYNISDSISCSVNETLNIGADHGAAVQRGIPYLWFNDSENIPRPYFHSHEDTIELIDIEKIERYVDIAETAIEKLASARPFFPFIRSEKTLIRPARFADISAIYDITRLAFEPVAFARIREKFFNAKLGGKEWHEYKGNEVAEFCKNNIYQTIVAEVGGDVVGYATYLLYPDTGIAEIGNNAVHPDYQGKGIGKLMQQEVNRRMHQEGYNKFQVSTLSIDLPAQRIYQKLGFTRVAESFWYLRNQ